MLTVLLLLTTTGAFAQGGPPLRTDDPGTPGPNKWEINIGVGAELSSAGHDYDLPNVDLNYGVGNNIQLKYEVPIVVSSGNPAALGYSKIGVKWRFIDEEKNGIAVSIYPQVSFNQNFQGTRFLMPVEVSKTINPVTIFAETGYNFIQGKMGEWLYAVAVGYNVTPDVEILGEAHGNVRADFKDDELLVNAGVRVRLAKKLLLLLSAGHTVRNYSDEQSRFIMYVGVRYLP
ncbi:MAG: hypothetical protein HY074_15970 [Deltaproteobacteria bacterium]|nr:hypothetical protein [Deltaproteobacteria bacterium]